MLYGIGKLQAYTKPTYLEMRNIGDVSGGGGYSDLGWVRMCGPEFQLLPYSKT